MAAFYNPHIFFNAFQGRKKTVKMETMPSPSAQRIIPVITDDLKKKIQLAVRMKESKGKKGVKKENITEEVTPVGSHLWIIHEN